MQAPPIRLRSPGPMLPAASGSHEGWAGFGVVRRLRAVWRGVAILGFTGVSIPVQALLLLLPDGGRLGRGKVVFARVYWATLCRLMGMRVRMLGEPARRGLGSPGRAVVFAANHSSWLDVLVVGGALEGCFIAKEEVGRWPLIRTVARLGRTVFVSRRAQDTGRERDAMRGRLRDGDNLVLFPEGTSNDGSRVLAFRSAFFSICEGGGEGGKAAGDGPLIQPVSVVYDRMGGLPIGRASRAAFAWYGDMDLASHFWKLAQRRGGLRASVMMHPALDPADFASRKELAAAVWATVAAGAASLRQNREAG